MEIINTKPGYKINCTGPSTLGATLNLGVSSNYDWNCFAISTIPFQRLGQIFFLQFGQIHFAIITAHRPSTVCAAQAGCRQAGRKYDWMQPMN